MIPTSIDGTDITGATIDGQDVQEITVDGDVVFSAQELPLRFSDLVIWTPFDASTYGGSNTDDVTAIIGGSGDDTAYNVDPHTNSHVQSGVFDISAGKPSGAYQITDNLDTARPPVTQTFTDMVWVNADSFSTGDTQNIIRPEEGLSSNRRGLLRFETNSNTIAYGMHDQNGNFTFLKTGLGSFNTNEWYHFAWNYDGSQIKVYLDGSLFDSSSYNETISNAKIGIGSYPDGSELLVNGLVDDFRHYDVVLTASEINQIYQNTDPAQNP